MWDFVMANETRSSKSILNTKVLDTLRQVSGDDLEFVHEVIKVFLDSASSQIIEIKNHLGRGDIQEIAMVAHALASNTGNVGAEAMSEICIQLSKMRKTGELGNAAELIEGLQRAFDQTKVRLKEFTG